MLSLLPSILVPALHYGCQIWGMHTPTGEAKAARQPYSPSMTGSYGAFVVSGILLALYFWKNWLCRLCKSFGGSRL